MVEVSEALTWMLRALMPRAPSPLWNAWASTAIELVTVTPEPAPARLTPKLPATAAEAATVVALMI